MTRIEEGLTTGEKVSEKSTPSWLNPLSISLAFSLSNVLSALYFALNTHLNDVHISLSRNQCPSVVLLESSKVIAHSLYPATVLESFFN